LVSSAEFRALLEALGARADDFLDGLDDLRTFSLTSEADTAAWMGATATIPDGRRIRVDGSRGVETLL
jgi:hypothetical protein